MRRDHPRVCGEQMPPEQVEFKEVGSPPRVRGTDNSTMEENLYRRITPACAGNRAPGVLLPSNHRDHPRVCGEQSIKAASEASMEGSPPRVRGTVAWGICHAKPSRITPACAGNRPAYPSAILIFWDHPRVCGEQ